MDERLQRIGKNEAVFRQVNEQVEGLNQTFSALTDRMLIVCECGDGDCIEQLELSLEEYEALRSDPVLFAIKPKHEIPDVEDVVSRNEGYWVVAKHAGQPSRLAERLDPRRPND